MPTYNFTQDFTADGSGTTISVLASNGGPVTVDSISVKKLTGQTSDNRTVSTFLEGNTDNGNEIFFRVDTQQIQLMDEFETFANPLAIVTKLQRGSLVKCFVAFGDEDFYELEGNATKGTSIVKVHSKNRGDITTPPIAREIRVSWRDGSKQLCRITQGGIIFLPTTMSTDNNTPEASAGSRGIS